MPARRLHQELAAISEIEWSEIYSFQ
jgi:hypothetical protein